MEERPLNLEKMKIGLISDTHGYIDDNILNHFKGCDEIWHAGDIGDEKVIEQLQSISKVRAVYGNIDDQKARISWPEEEIIRIGNTTIFMVHIGAYPPKYPKTLRQRLEQVNPDIFICGHSHILKVMKDNKHNLLYINPGAAGHHGFHKKRTIMLLTFNSDGLFDLKVVELGNRGQKKGPDQ